MKREVLYVVIAMTILTIVVVATLNMVLSTFMKRHVETVTIIMTKTVTIAQGINVTVEESKGIEVVEIRDGVVLLPYPKIRADVLSVEQALAYRRSIRDYLDKPLTIEQLSQLLWAAYGINDIRFGFKTCPSAGATYPLEIYVVVGEKGVVIDEKQGVYLTAGVYKYDPYTHTLKLVKKGDVRAELAEAALGQRWVREAPIDIVITAVFERTTRVYGSRGIRYVHMEVGHAGQNIYLEAIALGLGTVVVGAFYDDRVQQIIGAEPNEKPMYIVPVGVPKQPYRISEEDIADYIANQRAKRLSST